MNHEELIELIEALRHAAEEGVPAPYSRDKHEFAKNAVAAWVGLGRKAAYALEYLQDFCEQLKRERKKHLAELDTALKERDEARARLKARRMLQELSDRERDQFADLEAERNRYKKALEELRVHYDTRPCPDCQGEGKGGE